MTGLVITTPQDVNPGEFIEMVAEVQVTNKTTNRSGTIELWYGTNGTAPTVSGQSFQVVAGYAGVVVLSISTLTLTAVAGTTISVFGRITFGDQAAFGVDLLGSITTHTLQVAKAGE